MNTVTSDDLKKLYAASAGSHKGQNGRLLVIGGSHLFHAASLWSLTVASRIVDLVHYCSVPENNAIVQKAKEELGLKRRNPAVVLLQESPFYFSFVTQTTLGYGDVKPLGWTRLVAAVQVFIGVLLVTLILARAVSDVALYVKLFILPDQDGAAHSA